MRTLADRRHEQARVDADDRDLESRTDRRRQQDARETRLKALATRLVGLKSAALERLALDEELRSAIATARAIDSAPARNRQVNVVRQHLRALGPEVDVLLRRLDGAASALPAGGAASAPAGSAAPAGAAVPPGSVEARRWVARLLDEGDTALAEFFEQHPSAERQPLRQAMRELARAHATGSPAAVARAEARLCAALDDGLRQ
jgi:ribosome-associated protein